MPDPVKTFLSMYDEPVSSLALSLREFIHKNVSSVKEAIDAPAKMIHYNLSPGYKGMICTIIPSKKGVKLGFYKGSELPDPLKLLTGSGKVHRYVEIRSEKDLNAGLKKLLSEAVKAYRLRISE